MTKSWKYHLKFLASLSPLLLAMSCAQMSQEEMAQAPEERNSTSGSPLSVLDDPESTAFENVAEEKLANLDKQESVDVSSLFSDLPQTGSPVVAEVQADSIMNSAKTSDVPTEKKVTSVARVAKPVVKPKPRPNRYVVFKSGDSAEGIAQKIYGTTLRSDSLLVWNGPASNWKDGQKIYYRSAITPDDTKELSFEEELALQPKTVVAQTIVPEKPTEPAPVVLPVKKQESKDQLASAEIGSSLTQSSLWVWMLLGGVLIGASYFLFKAKDTSGFDI